MNHAVIVRYQIFHNLSHRYKQGFTPGDPMYPGYRGDIVIEQWQPVRGDVVAADALFFRHNSDDRPDGRSAPSMSVGDVLVLTGDVTVDDGDAWSCDSFGWRLVPRPEWDTRTMIHAASWRAAVEYADDIGGFR